MRRPRKRWKTSPREKIPVALAIRQAKKSLCRTKIGAVLFKGRDVLQCGFNYHSCYHDPSIKYSVHGERSALQGVRADIAYGSDMVIVRTNNKEKFLNCHPCQTCWSLLKKRGIRNLYCIQEGGDVLVFNISQMNSYNREKYLI